MARYTVCLKEHRDNIDYNRLKADAHKLQVADPSLSFDAAIAKATENVIAELKAQEAEIMALLGEEPAVEGEKVETAPKSAEPVSASTLRAMPLESKQDAENYIKAHDQYLAVEGSGGTHQPRPKSWKPPVIRNPETFEKLSKARELAGVKYWQLPYAEAAKQNRGLPKSKWESERTKRGLPVSETNAAEQPAPPQEAERSVEPEAKGEVQKAEAEPEPVKAESEDRFDKYGSFLSPDLDLIINSMPESRNKQYFKSNVSYELGNTNKASFSNGEYFYQAGKRYKLKPDGTSENFGTDFSSFERKLREGVENGTISYNKKAKALFDALVEEDRIVAAKAAEDKSNAEVAERNARELAQNTWAAVETQFKGTKFKNIKVKSGEVELQGPSYRGLIVARKPGRLAKGENPWYVYHIAYSSEGSLVSVIPTSVKGFATQGLAKVFAMRMADAMNGGLDKFGDQIPIGKVKDAISSVDPAIGYSASQYAAAVAKSGGDPYVTVPVEKPTGGDEPTGGKQNAKKPEAKPEDKTPKAERAEPDTTLQKDSHEKPYGMKPEALVAMLPGYAKRMMKDGKLVVVNDVDEAQAYSGQQIPDTSQGFYYPKQDRVVLIASMASSKENLMMVLNHELLHRAEFVDPDVKATMKRLDDQFFERFKLAKLGKGTAAEREAYRRIAYSTSPKEFHMLEFRAYLVSEYNRNPNSLTGYIKKLVQDFIAAIRIGLMRAGVSLKELTAADMNRIAETYGAQAYRRAEGEVTLFSNTAVADLWDDIAAVDKPASWDQVKMKAGKVRIKGRETFFSALTQNQLVDLLTEIMPDAKQFAKERNNYDREESKWHNRADDIANRWADIIKKDGKFRSEGNAQRNRLEQARIADLMHEMTVSEIDPRQPRPKDTGKNGIALHTYDQLKSKWDKLTPEAQTLINDVDKFHQDVTARLLETLTDKVQQAEMPEDSKAEIIKEIEAKFKQVKGPYFPLMRNGDYWIDHSDGVEMFETEGAWKAAKKDLTDKGVKIYGSGKSIKNFSKVEGVDANFLESMNDLIDTVADEQQANLLKDGVFQLYLQALPENSMRKRMIHRKKTPGWEKDALRSFAKKAFHDGKQLAKLRYAPAMRRVLTDLENVIKFANSDKQYALLNTRIETLKEAMDMLDNGVPFEGLAEKFGDDAEALRAVRRFARFKDEADRDKAMGDYLTEQEALLEQVDAFKALDDETKAENAADLLKALHKSYANMQESNTSWITNLVNQSVFTWMLGFNPASALINMVQTPGVSLPVMAGRHQMAKSSRVLGKAYRDFFTGKDPSGEVGIYSSLKDDGERKMFDALTENGLFDRTRSHDLAGLSDEGIARGTLWRTFMMGSTWAFHKAEVANREVTALAAYRLEFAKTGSVKQAIDYADKIVRDTHLDYSSANRPDLFQGNFARIMTQFKMYSQGMTYLWGKTFYDAFFSKAKSAEQKAEAKKVFYSLVGIQAATAGALGLPIGGIMLAAEAIAAMFDDDDEPVDVEIEIRKALADLLGETGGRVVARGLLSEVTGLDFHGRLSLADLWIREPDRELEGKDKAYYLMKTAFGPSGGLLEDILTGLKMVEEGNTERGLEKMLPKFISSFAKSLRMVEEGGATALSGEMLHEMNAWEKIAQGLGMRSAALAERQIQNSAIKNREAAVGETKAKLLHKAVNAKMKGDNEAFMEAMDDIKEFNAKYPDLRITPASIMKSIKTRKKNKANTKEGLVVKPKYEFIRDEENFL
jgi:hypothetical protein